MVCLTIVIGLLLAPDINFHVQGNAVFAFIILFVIGFAIGLGGTTWTIMTEGTFICI